MFANQHTNTFMHTYKSTKYNKNHKHADNYIQNMLTCIQVHNTYSQMQTHANILTHRTCARICLHPQ